MLSGFSLLVFFVFMIILMVIAIAKFKWHPFLAIMSTSLLLALFSLPLKSIPASIGNGFSGTFSSLGIVIILGAMIGTILEKTGAALTMADTVIHLAGKKRPDIAILLMGWIVSIPVFCDSGYVMLNPIRKALTRQTGISAATMVICLASGLYVSHVFIPPTPGPIAAAQYLGLENHILAIILAGLLISIPVLTAGCLFAGFIGKKIPVDMDNENDPETDGSYEALKARYGTLPHPAAAFSPVVIPILLMALKSAADLIQIKGSTGELIRFAGTPIIALSIGVIFSVILLFKHGYKEEFYDITNQTLKTTGPILFVTAGGGVLGKVISDAGIVTYISHNLPGISVIGILFPFLLAATLKTAQGSSTVAITTTAGIMGWYSAENTLMASLGLTDPLSAVLTVMAIGAGAMTVSHANDSYFWVVANFGGLKTQDAYKAHTLCTLIMGLTGILFIWLCHLLLV